MYKRNVYTGLLLTLVFAAFYFSAAQLSPSAALWPKAVCAAGAAFSLGNAGVSAFKWSRDRESGKVSAFPLSKAQLLRSVILLAVILVWVLLMERLGFLTASILCTIALCLLYEPERTKKHYIRDVIVAVVFSAVLYELFVLLGIHFPKGLLI